MKKTFKNGTAITFNRPSSANHGKTGTVVAKRDKATSPIGVMLEGKAAIVWTAEKFLTVNTPTPAATITVSGFNIGDTVLNTGRGSKSGMTGTVKKLRDAATNVGVEYTPGVTTWCKASNLIVQGSIPSSSTSIFAVGDLVMYVKPGMKRTGSEGTVKKFRADGRVGVNFRGSVITWCDEDSLNFAGDYDDMSDHDQSWDSDDWSDDFNDSADSVVINFKGINITVSKDCDVSITSEGVSVN